VFKALQAFLTAQKAAKTNLSGHTPADPRLDAQRVSEISRSIFNCQRADTAWVFGQKRPGVKSYGGDHGRVSSSGKATDRVPNGAQVLSGITSFLFSFS